MTDLTERLRKRVETETSCGNRTDHPLNHVNLMDEAATTLETLTREVERLRGLLIDPGDPAWEDARAVLAGELRKAGMDTHADNVAEGHALQIPSWIALNLIAHSRKSLTQENARLKAVSEDHFRNAQRLAGEVAKRDVENARLREALEGIVTGDVERVVAHVWRADGKPSKLDQCAHDVQINHDCPSCIEDHARKALGGGDEKQ